MLPYIVHWCVETRQNDDYFQELLDKVGGNIINEIHADGLTPLQFLVSNSWFWPFMRNNQITEDIEEDQLCIARFLLRNGASVNGYQDEINRTSESCRTPVEILCPRRDGLEFGWPEVSKGYCSLVRFLTSKGGKIYHKSEKEYIGILHHLVWEIHSDRLHNFTRYFSSTCVSQDQNSSNNFHGILKQIVNDIGIDVNERSEQGRTALQYCCLLPPRNNCLDDYSQIIHYEIDFVMKGLLEFNADINAQDKVGYTALMYAVKHNLFQQTALLMKYGANAYIQAENGMTALSLAYGCGDKTQLFLNTLRNTGAVFGEENNLIFQCQMYLNQVHRRENNKMILCLLKRDRKS